MSKDFNETTSTTKSFPFQPRVIRAKDAPHYLGIDRNKFQTLVRPYVTAIPLGKQAVGYDRVDLDDWLTAYKARNGLPGRAMKGGSLWGGKSHQGSSREGRFGGFKKRSEIKEFERALAQVTLSKLKDSSTT